MSSGPVEDAVQGALGVAGVHTDLPAQDPGLFEGEIVEIDAATHVEQRQAGHAGTVQRQRRAE